MHAYETLGLAKFGFGYVDDWMRHACVEGVSCFLFLVPWVFLILIEIRVYTVGIIADVEAKGSPDLVDLALVDAEPLRYQLDFAPSES